MDLKNTLLFPTVVKQTINSLCISGISSYNATNVDHELISREMDKFHKEKEGNILGRKVGSNS